MKRLAGTGACALAMLAIGAASLADARDAAACGGCFQPQENPTVVTDHRMLFSISPDQSTLYDQIRYSGSPSSFGWVLPIAGTVDVGLSADAVFGALDQITQTRLTSPPRNCPAPPTDCQFGAASGVGAPPAAPPPSAADGGVMVISDKVVGPYETVQLSSTNATALTDWLSSHGYVVDPAVQPVINAYVTEHFNFLALKLVPGAGVQSMRPVRVTTKGSTLSLPLRMISAGTGATVGISLWVIAEGRYQPQNFPFFHIEDNELAWDWNTNKSNYTDLRAQKEQALGPGKTWEIESSIPISEAQIRGYQYGIADTYYDPVKDPDGGVVTETATQVQGDDFTTMFHGIANARVTRMRADVAHAELVTGDLVLTASPDQSELPNLRTVTRELNQPQCPVYQGCQVVGTAPRDQAGGSGTGAGGGGGSTATCAAASPRFGSAWLLAGLGAASLALLKLRRRLQRR
jgi:hypothetical protein